ncbi:hypothetical protein PCNPT3_06115 [Psychromonas sp. CNPT3]|uniref:DUF6868 family protein n=1 Tax=Psychromonas sp. CNPT3 TaxID=314282 RepID=UPI00006E3204|nr:hypothetical protein PCNPT3_06115 [Psychromonas sp. CNPT3]
MINVEFITAFFCWCTLINLSFLILSVLFIYLFRSFAMHTHTQLLDIKASELPTLYFKFLAHYKLGIILFNLVPYIALKLMD